MVHRPTGTVTFLFTDIEGSTRLWVEHPDAMKLVVARHDAIVRTAIEGNGGFVFSTAGDSFAAVFPSAADALAAVVEAQLGVTNEEWGEPPIRVRMSLHTGEADERDGDYFGPVVNEAARLMAAADGGQILASVDVTRMAGGTLPDGVGWLDLGEVRLRDVDQPLPVVQLTHPELGSEFPPLQGLAETPHNLPAELTSFVGRDGELDEIADLVRSSRLVTLTGAGGSGKTRLALRYADGVLDEFPDGVWFVDLVVIDDPDRVVQSVARTVGVAEVAAEAMLDRLVERLQHRDTLLILDNCEHVLDAVASLAVEVLQRTGAVQILATSRQPLKVSGEQTFLVPTLEAPAGAVAEEAALDAYPAVRLFCDRAASAEPGFRVTAENADSVGRICRRLDGLPLALELAAARLNILTPAELQERLDDRFTILTGGSRDVLARHRTLAATLDWSYQLLTDEERTLLNRLSVFAGGFTLDAAEEVCSDQGILPGAVLDLVSSLVAKSLLVSSQGMVGRRFRFLETVRAYAAARLADGGETEELAEQHAGYFLRLAVDSYERRWGPEEADSLDRLDEEWPNLSRSLHWHLDEGHTEDGQMLVGSLRIFFVRRYHRTEGIDWLRRLVDADPTPSPGRALAVHALANFTGEPGMWEEAIELSRQYLPRDELASVLNNACFYALGRGDWETAREFSREQLPISREVGDPAGIYFAVEQAASLALADNDPQRALELREEALSWARQSGSAEAIVDAWREVGLSQRYIGDLDSAAAAYDEAKRLEMELGDKRAYPGWTEQGLAAVALDRGDIETAVVHLLEYNDAVERVKEDSQSWKDRTKPLPEWSRVAIARGEYEAAVLLLGAADSFRREFPWLEAHYPRYHADSERTLDAAKSQLDPDRYEAAWDRGIKMTSTEALDYAVATLDR